MKFRAMTWNVHHGTTGKELAADAEKFIKELGVDIFLLQEVKVQKNALDPFTRLGYRSRYATPEFAIVWNPKRFKYLRHRKVLMSPIKYWTINYSLVVVLLDLKTGKKIKCMSYHPPAHVQAPAHKTYETVSRVLRDVVQKWKRSARRSPNVDAHLYGGDDNVDESRGFSPKGGWDFMLNGPLTQITSPKGTHGKRRIDDFRIRGLKLVKKVGTFNTNSDHDAFAADFDYV